MSAVVIRKFAHVQATGVPPSGREFEIGHREQRATSVEVGGPNLRQL